jgi:hypothetical protein
MSSDYAIMIGVVSVILLVPLLLVFARDKWWNKTWYPFAKSVTFREVLRDWVGYVLIFTMFSLVLRWLLCLVCSYCEPC